MIVNGNNHLTSGKDPLKTEGVFLKKRLQRVEKRKMNNSENPPAGYFACLILLSWVSVLLFIGGCASPYSLDRKGNYYIERIPSSRAYLSDVTVNQEEGKLVIQGLVSRRIAAFSGIGHVDVAVVAPSGQVISQAAVPYEPKKLPKTPGARKHRPSRFEISLPFNPPKGSLIRLTFHGRPDPNAEIVYEHENLAVPDEFDMGG